ncbi:p-hydroxycinnamoyl CoA hydratase/lyase [Halorubrum trueperi]|uniref:p-hydroxycinnamoyl CoA hydratase/lyase n=1 Tax=Halorubrum trueperi TaxID=2004704 RepID=A0ABD5UGN4_9EURY
MASYSTIKLSITDNGVANLVLDRPEKQNSLSPELHHELLDALDTVEEENGRVLVISGNGDAFCGGMDLERAFLRPRRDGPQEFIQANAAILEAMTRLKHYPIPTVAKIDGWTFGGGYELMGVCDFAIARDDATFGLSEINFGIFPGGGTMWATVHTMNRRKAMYYAATGETFTGNEAEEYGAVTMAVPGEELNQTVDDLVESLLEKNPVTLRFNKEVFEKSRYMTFEDSVDYEMAKMEEMSYLQGEDWIETALKQFEDREFRPGLESYDTGNTDD